VAAAKAAFPTWSATASRASILTELKGYNPKSLRSEYGGPHKEFDLTYPTIQNRQKENSCVSNFPQKQALRQGERAMSISNLLIRNLRDVFGENDPVRRRAAIDEIWTEDGVFYDPKTGVHRGRDEIDRVAGAIRATHPDFRYQPIAEPEELGNAGRVRWVAGRPGEGPAYAGTDFIIASDGQIAALYLFFDKLP